MPAPADWDVSLILSEQKDDLGHTLALYGGLEYATNAIDASTAASMRARFEEILDHAVRPPEESPIPMRSRV